MKRLRADRIFFYLLLLLVTVITLYLIWPYIGSVVLAITLAVVLQPMHDWFLRRTGGRKGPATALTMVTTIVLVVIPTLLGVLLLLDAFATLSTDVANVMQRQGGVLIEQVEQVDRWLSSTGFPEGQFTNSIGQFITTLGAVFTRWLASVGISAIGLIVPMIVFMALLGALLANNRRAVRLFKELSPLDDGIDQLFLNRMRIMTKAMMLSIVVVAVAQGLVIGLLMALGGTPHIISLTLLAILLSILPGGGAIIAAPVGVAHILAGNIWAGLLIIVGTVTFVAALANQVRPLLVSKEAYLNRAVVLLSVLSGLAAFGFMGIVYGPLIMILFTTVLEVYLTYYRPGPPEITLSSPADAPISDAVDTIRDCETQ